MNLKIVLVVAFFILALAWFSVGQLKNSDIAAAQVGAKQKQEETTQRKPSETKVAQNDSTNSALSIKGIIKRTALIGNQDFQRKTIDLFSATNWNLPAQVAPPPPIRTEVVQATAPPIPFTYLGKKWADGAWEVYLSKNEEVVIVAPGSIIDGLYRVEQITPPLLTLTYLPMNQVQDVQIGAGD